jgi:hypothetical protein
MELEGESFWAILAQISLYSGRGVDIISTVYSIGSRMNPKPGLSKDGDKALDYRANRHGALHRSNQGDMRNRLKIALEART